MYFCIIIVLLLAISMYITKCIYYHLEPTAPRSLTIESTTDTTVTLSWGTPDPANGIIIYYQVDYKTIHGSYSSLWPFNTNLIRMVTGLVSNTEYNLRVTAFTVAGKGTSSYITAHTGKYQHSHYCHEFVNYVRILMCFKITVKISLPASFVTDSYNPTPYSFT